MQAAFPFELFIEKGWEAEKKVFNDSDNDLVIDFWKNKIGIDVAFNHRSFIGGDLLRLQAGAEIKNMINIGIYVCGTKNFFSASHPFSIKSSLRRKFIAGCFPF